jgi:molecular chaperone GrpE
LPVLDDFERAVNEMKKNKEDEWVKGVELIYEKFYKTLEKEGLKLVEVNKGDDFDPEIHEAIAQVPVDDEKMKNKIVDIVEKGYQLGHKIIRFPKVVTGR